MLFQETDKPVFQISNTVIITVDKCIIMFLNVLQY